MATTLTVLQLGARVAVAAGEGTVRFVGQTSFAPGKWVGVELDEANGKNDGSVAGSRYFSTAPLRGMFVKPGQVRLLEDGDLVEEVSPTPSRASTTAPARALPTSRPPTRTAGPPPLGAPRPGAAPPPTRTAVSARSSAASVPRSLSPLSVSSKGTTAAPRVGGRTVSASSSASSTPRISSAASDNSSTSGRPRPSSILQTIAPAPPTPGPSRSLSRPSSPRKLPVPSSVLRPVPGATPRAIPSISRSRPSILASTPRANLAPSDDGKLLATAATILQRPASGASNRSRATSEGSVQDEEDVEDDEGDSMSPRLGEDLKSDPFSLRGVDSRRLAEATVPKREHDELQAKYRILEARRLEDREKLREVERLKESADEWLKVREKSKAKILEMSVELKELRKQAKETTVDRDSFEAKLADLSDQIEMSLLDKEVAEERYEAAETSLALAKERVAELEVELEVVMAETARAQDIGEEAMASGNGAGSSLAYIQLEKQNARLKDALTRLRDLSSETDVENRHRIADLESELDLTSDLQSSFENITVELERAEAQVEDLKAQLDDASGAEEMLEQLTERNLNLNEKIDDMLGVIEDLEALKELNDELEENHIETEKQMQEEIDLKDLEFREQLARAESLEDNLADYATTIGQFRELVLSLQSDLSELRQHQADHVNESESLASQSQAMLNLNLKLQSSVLAGQVKTIDTELRKLDALQAAEHLSIIKPYLLPSFFEDDADAVHALLFFDRLAHKTNLVSLVIEQTHNVTESLNSVVPEDLIVVCETRTKLARFASLNRRFAAQLRRCTPELFIKMGRIYSELSSAEKKVDSFIESLRREELREADCGREVDGLIAQAEHLAELHIQPSLLDVAEREFGYLTTLDHDFDTIAGAAGFTKQALATISQDPDVAMGVGADDMDDVLFKPLQRIVNQSRNSKVVTKKLLRRLDELSSGSAALSPEHAQGCETLAHNSSAIALAVSKLATQISSHCSQLRTTKSPFQIGAVLAIAREIVSAELGKTSAQSFDEIATLLGQLAQDALTTLTTAMEVEHVIKLAFTPPWISRVKELQESAAVNVDAERKVAKLNEEMKELAREIRAKDQSNQESTVKIELMERRMEGAKKQADSVIELESELIKSKKQEKAYEEAIEALQGDLDAMEGELQKVKSMASILPKGGSNQFEGEEGDFAAYEGNMETSRLVEQIDSLRRAVRFLRSENTILKSQDLLEELSSLPTYDLPPSPPASPDRPTGLPSHPHRRLPADPFVSRQSFASQSRALLREARVLASTPRMVDISFIKPLVPSSPTSARRTISRSPLVQYTLERERVASLGRRVDSLAESRPSRLVHA